MDEQKLNKKLAEWAGFTYKEEYYYGNFRGQWLYPEVSLPIPHSSLPDFTQSLDACFKHLVPKVIKCYEVKLHTAEAWSRLFNTWLWCMVEDNPNPALALCLAIEKLIDRSKDGK